MWFERSPSVVACSISGAEKTLSCRGALIERSRPQLLANNHPTLFPARQLMRAPLSELIGACFLCLRQLSGCRVVVHHGVAAIFACLVRAVMKIMGCERLNNTHLLTRHVETRRIVCCKSSSRQFSKRTIVHCEMSIL